MESGKKLEANDLDIENRQKLQLLEMYERAFDGPEQQLSLTAVTTFNHLTDKYKKEEICVIAEILKALATAPIVLHVWFFLGQKAHFVSLHSGRHYSR